MSAFFYALALTARLLSVAALNRGDLLRYLRGFAIENANLSTDKLHRLLGSIASILAPDLSTVVEDTGRQRVYGCDMVLSHSAFLLIWWIN